MLVKHLLLPSNVVLFIYVKKEYFSPTKIHSNFQLFEAVWWCLEISALRIFSAWYANLFDYSLSHFQGSDLSCNGSYCPFILFFLFFFSIKWHQVNTSSFYVSKYSTTNAAGRCSILQCPKPYSLIIQPFLNLYPTDVYLF